MLFINLPWLFTACVIFSYEIHASSHWMVTESGFIQPRLDSPFDMARPNDLLGFLNQEKRWDYLFDLFRDLRKRQIEIDKLWADVGKITKVGRQISKDYDCLKAGNIKAIDWYAALLEDGSNKIHQNEYLLPNPYYGSNTDTPDCKKISSLDFSMFAYEHLVSMKERANLSAESEYILPDMVSQFMSVDQYGHWLTGMLHLNSSSWLHYHLASLFWRIRGSIPKAVECSRRALHYAPRVFKDVALLGLGMAFHRTRRTNDAVTIFKAAVDHDLKNYVSHFSAANAYTIAGDFNNSLKFYDKTLKLNPRIEIATKHKYGVQCHAKLAVRIKEIRELFNKLREELNEYDLKQTQWPKVQSEFLRTLKNGEEYDYRTMEKGCERMSLITGLDVKKLKREIEKNSLIKYFLDGPLYSDEKLGKKTTDTTEIIYSLERLILQVSRNEKPIDMNNANSKHSASLTEMVEDAWTRTKKEMWKKHFPDVKYPSHFTNQNSPNVNIPLESMSEYETGIFFYPPMMTVNRNVEDFDKEIDWPSEEFCKAVPKVRENLGAIIPIFLPFENKGIRLKSLLTEKIGVPLSEEYELPWHPPACTQERDVLKKYKHGTHEVLDTGYLRTKLLEYVSDGNIDAALHMQDAEIGQRIYAAMKKKVAPKWMLLTLSSLYWRVRKNNANALQCLHTAIRWVQEEYKDLVLASISSIFLEMGYIDEALSAADAAFRISLYEPATNFLLAQISILKKNHNTHMFHLKQTVRVEPRYLGGLARSRLDNWACLMKQLSAMKEMDIGEGDICTHVKPIMNVVCKKDNDGCHMSNIQCYSSQERVDASKLVMLLKEKDTHQKDDVLDVSFFDHIIANSPTDQSDMSAHNANYDNMVKIIESSLNGCGQGGCKTLKPEDVSMKKEDCSHHHLLFGYWIHIVSFRQLLTDSNAELPSEIALMTPTSKKLPECRIVGLEDFVTEKLARVSSDGWEPVLSLMHQFTEIFDSFDYVTLGAKIARYVDTRPNSWTGLLGAGWWCGAGGRGACAVRCLSAAHASAPPAHRHYALRALTALLHMQSKQKEAKEVAILSFYLSPKSKIEAFLVAVSYSYLGEYDQATWMYRYALALDGKFIPAKACLHATMCLMFFGDKKKAKEL